MKINNLIYRILSVVLVVFVFSCESTELDLQENPNALTVDSADPGFVLNGIAINFGSHHLGLSGLGNPLTRMINQFGTYANNAPNTSLNGPWANLYSIGQNVEFLKTISETDNLPNHVGVGQVMQAFAYVNMVDYLGSAAFSEALNPDEFPNPGFDDGQTIYTAMFGLLDEAIINLNAENSITLTDPYFNGDTDRWVDLANTLKIKMYVQTKLVNTGSASNINTIVNSGNFISDNLGDFQIQFATNQTQPDARHPQFVNNYQVNANGFMSNSYMDLLLNDKTIGDPRTPYYLYRQVLYDPDDPAVLADGFLPCAGDPDFDFCYIGDGYWGRDHADDEGIPNIGSQITTWGIYPVGGAFDAAGTQSEETAIAMTTFDPASGLTMNEHIFNSLSNVNPVTSDSNNLGGAGIHPMVLSSFTHFMLAEAALPAPVGLGANGDPLTLLIQGINLSFEKIESFSSLPMDPSDKQTYIDDVTAMYNAATSDSERLNIIMKEYYLASWGNGVEPYNNYRRTGFPALQGAVVPAGEFPRSFFIPDSEINSNNNPDLTQKVLTDQVFWDTNPAGFIQ